MSKSKAKRKISNGFTYRKNIGELNKDTKENKKIQTNKQTIDLSQTTGEWMRRLNMGGNTRNLGDGALVMWWWEICVDYT